MASIPGLNRLRQAFPTTDSIQLAIRGSVQGIEKDNVYLKDAQIYARPTRRIRPRSRCCKSYKYTPYVCTGAGNKDQCARCLPPTQRFTLCHLNAQANGPMGVQARVVLRHHHRRQAPYWQDKDLPVATRSLERLRSDMLIGVIARSTAH